MGCEFCTSGLGVNCEGPLGILADKGVEQINEG